MVPVRFRVKDPAQGQLQAMPAFFDKQQILPAFFSPVIQKGFFQFFPVQRFDQELNGLHIVSHSHIFFAAGNENDAGCIILFPKLQRQLHAGFFTHQNIQNQQMKSRLIAAPVFCQAGFQLLGAGKSGDLVGNLFFCQDSVTEPADSLPHRFIILADGHSVLIHALLSCFKKEDAAKS